MDAYVYQGALVCAPCGCKIRSVIAQVGGAPDNWGDESSYDSDDFPKGPYLDGGGESDAPEHCVRCGVFLANPLTDGGYAFVRMTTPGSIQDLWWEYYEICPACHGAHGQHRVDDCEG